MSDSEASSSLDRRKWPPELFNALIEMVKQQQTQIESLVNERKHLEDYIKLQSNRWESYVELLKGQISQVNRKLSLQEMINRVDAAKAELFLGFKQKEALICKIKLDSLLDDLSDFRTLYNHMSTRPDSNNMNSSEMLAFKSEIDFVWNQYKKMESDLNNRLKTQGSLIENGDSKIKELVANTERLESSNADKDELILNLKAELARLEADSMKKGEDVFRLKREVESLRKGSSENKTRIMGGGGGEGRSLRRKSSSVSRGPREVESFRKSSSENKSRIMGGGEGRSSKRKSSEISNGPRLFTSQFKIPKLKMPTPYNISKSC